MQIAAQILLRIKREVFEIFLLLPFDIIEFEISSEIRYRTIPKQKPLICSPCNLTGIYEKQSRHSIDVLCDFS